MLIQHALHVDPRSSDRLNAFLSDGWVVKLAVPYQPVVASSTKTVQDLGTILVILEKEKI